MNNQSGKQSTNPKAILNGEQSGKAIVQAGAYTSESQAKQIQQRLAQAGIKTHINEVNTAKGTTVLSCAHRYLSHSRGCQSSLRTHQNARCGRQNYWTALMMATFDILALGLVGVSIAISMMRGIA